MRDPLPRAATGSRLNFTGTLGYLDAQFDEFITNVADYDATAIRPGRPRGRSTSPTSAGSRTRRNGRLSGTLDYRTPLGGGRPDASTTLSYRSKTYQFELPSPFLDQKGYALWDANLVWNSDGDRVPSASTART